MRTVSKSATFLATESVNSAPFKREETEVQIFWQGKAQNSSPILRCTFLARRSAKLIARQGDVTSVFLSLSLSLSVSLSLSLSPNVPHAQYRKRFRASYNEAGLPKSLIVGSIYRPPNTPIEPFLRNLERCLSHKRKMGDHLTILAGDFNSRNSIWYYEDLTDEAGESLHQLFCTLNMEQRNHFPTNIYAGQLRSCLNLVATDIIGNAEAFPIL